MPIASIGTIHFCALYQFYKMGGLSLFKSWDSQEKIFHWGTKYKITVMNYWDPRKEGRVKKTKKAIRVSIGEMIVMVLK